MNMRIVYTRPDGGVSVCVPAPGARRPKETNDQWLARVIVSDVPSGASDVHIVDVDALPADRTFRNAWAINDGQVGVDMVTARDVHRNRLRQARKPLLDAADVEMTRAFKDPAKQDEIEARRQALRDVTEHPDIEAAQTPAELAKVWPLPTDNPTPPVIPPVLHMPADKPKSWSLSELLQRAEATPEPEPEPVLSVLEPAPSHASSIELPPEAPRPPEPDTGLSDSQRRSAARVLIAEAVSEASRRANTNQVRYEMALQAKNGQVTAMSLFEEEAAIRNVTVSVLAEQIVAQRLALERRMSHVYTIEARALSDIEKATGDAIDALAAAAATEINHGE